MEQPSSTLTLRNTASPPDTEHEPEPQGSRHGCHGNPAAAAAPVGRISLGSCKFESGMIISQASFPGDFLTLASATIEDVNDITL